MEVGILPGTRCKWRGGAPRDALGYGDTEFAHAAMAVYIASGMAAAGGGTGRVQALDDAFAMVG